MQRGGLMVMQDYHPDRALQREWRDLWSHNEPETADPSTRTKVPARDDNSGLTD